MPSTRFDQQIDRDYARCKVCETTFATEALTHAHMEETLADARALFDDRKTDRVIGHSMTILNPSRTDKIRRYVDTVVSDALSDAVEKIANELDRVTDAKDANDPDITQEELDQALRSWPDLISDIRESLAEIQG